MGVSVQEISNAVERLKLDNKPICIHSSLKSFGSVDNGGETIIQGFLDKGCTVVVPTFSNTFATSPPTKKTYYQNGNVNARLLCENNEEKQGQFFTPNSNVIGKEMGAIPRVVLQNYNRIRGNHPLHSFSAIGPLAEKIVGEQHGLDVYAPLKSLVQVDGYVVLMGVDFDRLTLLHLAEQLAGRNMFRKWAKDINGTITEVEIGGCSRGFNKFNSVLTPAVNEIVVGESLWKVLHANTILDFAVNAIKDDPLLTHCGDDNCGRCNDAVKGGPILEK